MGQFLAWRLDLARPWWDSNVLITLRRDVCQRGCGWDSFWAGVWTLSGRGGTATYSLRSAVMPVECVRA